MTKLRITAFSSLFALVAAAVPAEAIDLRTEVGGQGLVRRVNYEWTTLPEESDLPTLSSPEQILVEPSVDGPCGCGPTGCSSNCGPCGCGPNGCSTDCGRGCGSARAPVCGFNGCSPAGCGQKSCQGSCSFCCNDNLWFGVEYLNWWQRVPHVPPLVTDGVLPTANVIFGNEDVFDDSRPGVRVTVGWWAEPCRQWGLLGRWYGIRPHTIGFQRSGDGQQVIVTRPFFNLSAANFGNDIAGGTVGGNPGSVEVRGRSELQGGDLLLRKVIKDDCKGSLDLLFGYNAALFDQDLAMRSISQLPGGNSVLSDLFSTQNRFHAASLGLLSQSRFNCMTFELLGKMSFGGMFQQARVAGALNGSSAGLLAQAANSGEFENDVFVVAPEIGLNLIYHPNPCMDLNVGYSFLYWSSVAQAADLIDPQLRANPNSPPLPADVPHPSFAFRNSDFYVHGINVGLRISF